MCHSSIDVLPDFLTRVSNLPDHNPPAWSANVPKFRDRAFGTAASARRRRPRTWARWPSPRPRQDQAAQRRSLAARRRVATPRCSRQRPPTGYRNDYLAGLNGVSNRAGQGQTLIAVLDFVQRCTASVDLRGGTRAADLRERPREPRYRRAKWPESPHAGWLGAASGRASSARTKVRVSFDGKALEVAVVHQQQEDVCQRLCVELRRRRRRSACFVRPGRSRHSRAAQRGCEITHSLIRAATRAPRTGSSRDRRGHQPAERIAQEMPATTTTPPRHPWSRPGEPVFAAPARADSSTRLRGGGPRGVRRRDRGAAPLGAHAAADADASPRLGAAAGRPRPGRLLIPVRPRASSRRRSGPGAMRILATARTITSTPSRRDRRTRRERGVRGGRRAEGRLEQQAPSRRQAPRCDRCAEGRYRPTTKPKVCSMHMVGSRWSPMFRWRCATTAATRSWASGSRRGSTTCSAPLGRGGRFWRRGRDAAHAGGRLTRTRRSGGRTGAPFSPTETSTGPHGRGNRSGSATAARSTPHHHRRHRRRHHPLAAGRVRRRAGDGLSPHLLCRSPR